MPDAGILATGLLLLGLFLLGLEFFIPSFGMILVFALLSLVISFWSACKAWWGESPVFFWTYVFVLVGGVPSIVIGAIGLMQKTRLGSRVILAPAPPAPSETTSPLDDVVGMCGVSQTVMTPGGMVEIDRVRYHAESIGMPIEPGTPVIVVSAKTNRLVVRPATPADMAPENSATSGIDSSPKEADRTGTNRTDVDGSDADIFGNAIS